MLRAPDAGVLEAPRAPEDRVPADFVPPDLVPAQGVPADRVPADRVPGDGPPDPVPAGLSPLPTPSGCAGPTDATGPTGSRRRRVGGARLLRRAGRRSPAEAAALVVFVLVFVNWFRIGQFFATGDVAPFLRQGVAAEFGRLWTHENSGAGGVAYSVVRLPELLCLGAARLLGGGAPLAQRLLFAAMYAFGAGGAATLLRRFCTSPVVVVVGGVLAAFNLFTLSFLPNYLPVVAIGVVGLVVAAAVDAVRGDRPVRRLVLATVPLGYVAMNPPLIAVVAVLLAASPLVAAVLTGTGRAGVRRAAGLLVRAGPYLVVCNLWWALPQRAAVAAARAGDSIGTEIDVRSWAWTHRNNAPANLMTLRSDWSWPDPQTHGAAASLGRPALAWLAWLLPLGVALAPLVARRSRRPAAALAVGCAGLWVLAKGLHPPFASFNAFLYDRVPGFWLLREPMSKVVVVLLPAMLLSWGLTVEGLAGWRSQARRCLRPLLSGALVLLIAGPLVLTWPLATGRATRDEQPGRSEQVTVPAGWFELAAAVDAAPVEGKLLVLPLADFYQLPTTWGFYGTDVLVRGLVSRPVLQRNPQGYLTDLPGLDGLLRAGERAVLSGRQDAVGPLLRTLGAGLVLVRHDLDVTSTVRPTRLADAAALVAALDALPGVRRVAENEQGTLYAVDGGADAMSADRDLVRFSGWDDEARTLAAVVTADRIGSTALTDDTEAPATGALHAVVVDDADVLALDRPATVRLTRPASVPARFRLTTAIVGGELEATATELDPPRLASLTLVPRVARWRLGTDTVGLDVDGRFVALPTPGSGVDLVLGPDSVVRPVQNGVGPSGTAQVAGPLSPLRDCLPYDGRTAAEVGLRSSETSLDGATVVRLEAADHRACRLAELAGAMAGTRYRVRQAMRTERGAPASICLWAVGPDRCVDLPVAPPAGPDGWTVLDTTATLPDGTVGAQLFLYADRPAGGEPLTVSEYRSPDVTLVRTGAPLAFGATMVPTQTVRLLAGNWSLTRFGTSGGEGSWSEVGDCDRRDRRTPAEVGIMAVPNGTTGSVRLQADDHTACVHRRLPALDAGRDYVLTLPYQSVRGATPRVCVFDPGTARCVPLGGDAASGGELAAVPGLSEARITFRAPAAALDLYVYADGRAGGTAAEYGPPRLRSADAEIVTAVVYDGEPAPADATPPGVSAETAGAGRWRVSVATGDRAPVVVGIGEAFDEGWRLDGVPSGVEVRHVRLDGFRNGWVLEAGAQPQSFTGLDVRFGPDGLARRALAASLVGAVALAAGVGVPRRRGTGPGR